MTNQEFKQTETYKKICQLAGRKFEDKEEALRWAADKGCLDIVKYLVEQGADIHARNECALRWASEKGHRDVVKFLKEQENE